MPVKPVKTVNHKIEVRDTGNPFIGKGVFAREKIFKGEIIGDEEGQIISNEEYWRLPERYRQYCYDIDDDRIICPLDFENLNVLWFFNHSCNPNLGSAVDIYYLTAMRDIEPEEELTYDYSMLDSNESTPWKMECHCGSKNCRKFITASDWKLPELRERYKGFFQKNVQEKIDQQERIIG